MHFQCIVVEFCKGGGGLVNAIYDNMCVAIETRVKSGEL